MARSSDRLNLLNVCSQARPRDTFVSLSRRARIPDCAVGDLFRPNNVLPAIGLRCPPRLTLRNVLLVMNTRHIRKNVCWSTGSRTEHSDPSAPSNLHCLMRYLASSRNGARSDPWLIGPAVCCEAMSCAADGYLKVSLFGSNLLSHTVQTRLEGFPQVCPPSPALAAAHCSAQL